MENGQAFAHMLNEGIYAIQRQESVERRKPIGEIQEELGSSINRQSSTIAYYLRGHTPNTLAEVEQLAKEIVRRGGMDREWVEKFLRYGDHTNPKKLGDTLFATEPEQGKTVYEQEVVALSTAAVHVAESKTQYADVRDLASFDERPVGRNSVADDLLVHYFTDAVVLRTMFKDLLAAPTLRKRLLIIYGVGGAGKTSLLRIFRLYAKSQRVPVALVSANEAKSPVDILATWVRDLRSDGVELTKFLESYNRYCAIQSTVYEQSQLDSSAAARLPAKGPELTGNQPISGALQGFNLTVPLPNYSSADAIQSWLRQFLMKSDIDLWLDPVQKLTIEFLSDLRQVAANRRISLLLDTYEQMTAYEDWLRTLVQEMPDSVLVVIAGRSSPNWGRSWAGWAAQTNVREVKAMEVEEMRTLAGQYYEAVHGVEVDNSHVEAIVRFARGLPLVVTSAIDLCVHYGYNVTDFEAVKPQVTSDLVDRLIEGVPPELLPVLEVVAVLRWFNREMLRFMFKTDVSRAYDELRHFSFVRPRAEGLALHDTIREMVNEYLKLHDPQRYRQLHDRAATYFERKMESATDTEAERLGLERLYHRLCTNEESGIVLFQQMAQQLDSYQLVNRLRTLLNDVNIYPLEYENSRLWRDYYSGRLAHLEGKRAEAEEVYQAIIHNQSVEPKLRAFASCDWGEYLVTSRRLREVGGIERAKMTIEQGFGHAIDSKLIWNYVNLGGMYARLAEDAQALESYDVALQFTREHGDNLLAARVISYKQDVFARQGNWKEMFLAYNNGLQQIPRELEKSIARSTVLSAWKVAWAWAGKYADAERDLKQAETIEHNLGLREFLGLNRDLGFVLGMQGFTTEALEHLENSSSIALQKDEILAEGVSSSFMGMVLLKAGRLQESGQRLLHALEVKQALQANRDIPEVLVWLGQLEEVKSHNSGNRAARSAESYYEQAASLKWTKRYYFECAALTGIIRAKQMQGDYATIPQLLAEAEQLAQQYEYNDHFASLSLTQGHLAWNSNVSSWRTGFDVALGEYQKSLIYSLRYNRYLLDEVLSGRPEGTPLQPIIPYCLSLGEDGRRMLSVLGDWWGNGSNDIGVERPDTISSIPEGISLLEGERIARAREPGDGMPQRTVIQQIEAALR